MVFLHGLLVGLSYSVPIGIQNLFVINTALTQSRRCSVVTAFWVIIFDTTLAAACFFGVGLVMEQIKWLRRLILLAGSLVVIYMGAGLLAAKAAEPDRSQQRLSLGRIIATACVVTWGNPQAFIDGTLMLGAFQAALPKEAHLMFIGGVVAASCLWFSGLIIVCRLFGRNLNGRFLRWLNIGSGLVIIAYGLRLLLSFFQEFNIF